MSTERPEAERLDADTRIDIAAEIIDDRDETIASLQRERDAALERCRFYNVDGARLEQERDAATREVEALREACLGEAETVARLQLENNQLNAKLIAIEAGTEALREEVGRSEGKQLAMPRRERVPFVLDEEEAPAQPSADDTRVRYERIALCMLPEGAGACPHFAALADEIHRLTSKEGRRTVVAKPPSADDVEPGERVRADAVPRSEAAGGARMKKPARGDPGRLGRK